MASIKEIIRNIERHVVNTAHERQQALNLWMDYMIDLFDYSNYLTPDGFVKAVQRKHQESAELMQATIAWIELSANEIEKRKATDILGTVYEEMFLSHGKASATGQFFTPLPLCDLMSLITTDTEHKLRVNDCACGSGRTLISHYMTQFNKTGIPPSSYYIGEDIDISSVKMCALNMMIHGMHGRVIRHDTLKEPITFDYGFEVNEVRYPFPTPFYSLRRISHQEKQQKHEKDKNTQPKVHVSHTPQPKADDTGQFSLF